MPSCLWAGTARANNWWAMPRPEGSPWAGMARLDRLGPCLARAWAARALWPSIEESDVWEEERSCWHVGPTCWFGESSTIILPHQKKKSLSNHWRIRFAPVFNHGGGFISGFIVEGDDLIRSKRRGKQNKLILHATVSPTVHFLFFISSSIFFGVHWYSHT